MITSANTVVPIVCPADEHCLLITLANTVIPGVALPPISTLLEAYATFAAVAANPIRWAINT